MDNNLHADKGFNGGFNVYSVWFTMNDDDYKSLILQFN